MTATTGYMLIFYKRREEPMRYKYYKEQIESADSREELEKLLRQISDDVDGTTDRQYKWLRYLILKKIWA